MAKVIKALADPLGLTTGAATVYTVPASTTGVVTYIHLCNPTAAPATVRMWIFNGTSSLPILYDKVVPPNDYVALPVWFPLTTAWRISASCSIDFAVFLTLSGYEIKL